MTKLTPTPRRIAWALLTALIVASAAGCADNAGASPAQSSDFEIRAMIASDRQAMHALDERMRRIEDQLQVLSHGGGPAATGDSANAPEPPAAPPAPVAPGASARPGPPAANLGAPPAAAGAPPGADSRARERWTVGGRCGCPGSSSTTWSRSRRKSSSRRRIRNHYDSHHRGTRRTRSGSPSCRRMKVARPKLQVAPPHLRLKPGRVPILRLRLMTMARPTRVAPQGQPKPVIPRLSRRRPAAFGNR